jgi:internalin A
MKQILVMMVVVGCGDAPPDLRNRLVLEEAIRDEIEKPEGELTEEDFAKVTNLILTGEQQVGDECLKEVAKLQKLEYLELSNTRITDEGLKEVAKMQKLTNLGLFGTKITDEGLKEVTKLQHLTHLGLSYTKITDAGLKEVAKMQKLTNLGLFGTKITDAGVAELKNALPNCYIQGP